MWPFVPIAYIVFLAILQVKLNGKPLYGTAIIGMRVNQQFDQCLHSSPISNTIRYSYQPPPVDSQPPFMQYTQASNRILRVHRAPIQGQKAVNYGEPRALE